MFQKVLVPLDGSKLAEGILPFVSQLARGLSSSLVLLSVIDLEATDIPKRQREGLEKDRLEREVKRPLQEVADRLGAEGITAESVVSFGRPAEQILQIAQREECDLIAMSTHGRTALGRGILGSVTDRVIHSSPVPTLAIASNRAREYQREDTTLSKIIVPLDGSGLSESVLPYVKELARSLSLEIMLVRVIDTGGPYAGLLDDARFVGVDEEIEAEVKGYLKEVCEGLLSDGLKAQWQVLTGTPATAIVDIAKETPQDMVALTTHGNSGLTRWFLGSVADKLVRASGDPVLVVPPKAVDEANN